MRYDLCTCIYISAYVVVLDEPFATPVTDATLSLKRQRYNENIKVALNSAEHRDDSIASPAKRMRVQISERDGLNKRMASPD